MDGIKRGSVYSIHGEYVIAKYGIILPSDSTISPRNPLILWIPLRPSTWRRLCSIPGSSVRPFFSLLEVKSECFWSSKTYKYRCML